MLNRQGRPTAVGAAEMRENETFSGNRGLADRGAADLRDRADGYDGGRSAGAGQVLGAARQDDAYGTAGTAGAVRAGDDAALRAAEPKELRHRHRHLSARVVHDEAQPAPQREDGAAAGLRRCASAAAIVDGHRCGRADRRVVALALGADRHAGHRDDAEGRRARGIVRHDGDQGRAGGAWR